MEYKWENEICIWTEKKRQMNSFITVKRVSMITSAQVINISKIIQKYTNFNFILKIILESSLWLILHSLHSCIYNVKMEIEWFLVD